jgi:pimeloyl-ACP methyl ester carboxylesterase
VIFGSLDDHFTDPAAEAAAVAAQLRGEHVIVDGAGHYPHVERPDVVSEAIVAFLSH